MPSRDGLAVARFRHIGVLLTWTEAVAIVLETSEQVQRAGGTLVTPDLEHIRLGPDGMVTIVPGSPIPAHPVQQAARLLKALIQDAPAPPDLNDLLARNDQTPPAFAWIEEFTTALAYFERPQRSQILADIARRAAARQATMAASFAPPSSRDVAPDSGPPRVSIAQRFRRWFRS